MKEFFGNGRPSRHLGNLWQVDGTPVDFHSHPGKPSWLSDRGSLAATLPSRRGLGALNQEDEAHLVVLSARAPCPR